MRDLSPDVILIERLGGMAGFGGSGGRLRGQGRVNLAALPEAEQHAVEALFSARAVAAGRDIADGFRYRLTRTTARGIETVEVIEAMVPASLGRCVKDELA